MLSVVIQAGGQSSRMGEDKALKLFLGRPLIQRVIDRIASIADEIIITTNAPEDYQFLNLPLMTDLKPGRGALGGLYTAIAVAGHPVVAVVACDLPFASSKLIRRSCDLLLESGSDVVIPETDQGLEPLQAVYRRESCLPAIESALAADQWKVIAWFPKVKVRVLSPEETSPFNPDGITFWNLNTPEEFAAAELRASNEDRSA